MRVSPSVEKIKFVYVTFSESYLTVCGNNITPNWCIKPTYSALKVIVKRIGCIPDIMKRKLTNEKNIIGGGYTKNKRTSWMLSLRRKHCQKLNLDKTLKMSSTDKICSIRKTLIFCWWKHENQPSSVRLIFSVPEFYICVH